MNSYRQSCSSVLGNLDRDLEIPEKVLVVR
jgi:hypothetical protein